MATKPKSPEEHRFNEHIYQYMNCEKFEAVDFDNLEEVQNLFQIYMEDIHNSDTPSNRRLDRALKEFYTNTNEFKQIRLTRDVHNENINSVRYANGVMNLFKTTHLSVALEINDKRYINLISKIEYMNNRYYIRDNPNEEIIFKPLLNLNEDDMIEAKENWGKIQGWHNYCLAAKIVKVFVLNMYPTFDDLSIKETKQAKQSLEKFVLNLKATSIYEDKLDDMLDIIVNSKHSLTQPKKIKIQRLLDLNLPRITERTTAIKIVEGLIPPYN